MGLGQTSEVGPLLVTKQEGLGVQNYSSFKKQVFAVFKIT